MDKLKLSRADAEALFKRFDTNDDGKLDQDEYNKEPNCVYVYIMSGVDGVGDVKERVTCDFTASTFDLRILDLNGKNYRLRKTGLEKSIEPAQCKAIVKKNKITIKMKKARAETRPRAPRQHHRRASLDRRADSRLARRRPQVKGTYGYDHWAELCSKRPKLDEDGKEKDPGTSRAACRPPCRLLNPPIMRPCSHTPQWLLLSGSCARTPRRADRSKSDGHDEGHV